MSGFLAFLETGTRSFGWEELDRAMSHLRERGPDGAERWGEARVKLLFTRFVSHDGEAQQRITRLADGGALAAQLRLDDRDALRTIASDARARDDASLLAAVFDARGESALPSLLGDFSVATVHPHTGDIGLRAWRDNFGVRPLFYVRQPEYVAVGNTIAALLALPGVPDDLDPSSVREFLLGRDASDRERTWYRSVRRVPPAHVMTVRRDGRVQLRRYWEPRAPEILRLRDEREYPERFRAALESAVRDRLRTPSTSVIMSGGLDSTALAGIARRVGAEGCRIGAVTAVYSHVVRSDETVFARAAARAIDIPLVEVDADRLGYLEEWTLATNRIVPAGEPDLALWVQLLRNAAAMGRSTMLGFDGDALLSPPDIATLVRRQSLWRVAMEAGRYRLEHGVRPHLNLRGVLRRARSARHEWSWVRAQPAGHAPAGAGALVHRTAPEMWSGLTGPLWDHIFDASDVGFTGVPVEARFPLLDRRVVDLALSVPPIPWLQRKLLLRQAMRGVLPEEVRLRPKVSFAGYFEGRLDQLVRRRGARVHLEVMKGRIDDFVDVTKLPQTLPHSDFDRSLALLRVRELNDWLASRETRLTPQGGCTHGS